MAVVRDDFHTLGLQRAIEALGVPPRSQGDATSVRQWINDHVSPTTLMYATTADFWLALKKRQGPQRRKQKPPESPFRVRGAGGKAAEQAQRAEVEIWHEAWVAREGVMAQYDALADKVDAVSVSLLKTLRAQHPWVCLVASGFVVGYAEAVSSHLLERALTDPEQLRIEQLTMDQALRRQWFDQDERGWWIHALRKLQQGALEELESSFNVQYSALRKLALTDVAASSKEVDTEPPVF